MVVTAQSAEAAIPKRASLPSSEPLCSIDRLARAGLGWYSAHRVRPRPATNRISMLARMARLWRRSLT
ncbi:hypothetical protein D3C78_1980060 [compost metagenome]